MLRQKVLKLCVRNMCTPSNGRIVRGRECQRKTCQKKRIRYYCPKSKCFLSTGWLYGLTTLRYLSLSRNEVDYIADDGWEFCKSLDTLDLGHNSLLILERESLLNLPKLRKLYLQHNQISHVQTDEKGPPVFGDVPSLEELWLDGNQISHTVEDTTAPFRSLTNLKLISLRCINAASSAHM